MPRILLHPAARGAGSDPSHPAATCINCDRERAEHPLVEPVAAAGLARLPGGLHPARPTASTTSCATPSGSASTSTKCWSASPSPRTTACGCPRWPRPCRSAGAGSPTPSRAWRRRAWSHRGAATDDGRGIVAQLTDKGYALLVEAAPVHVTGVREHMVDLASDDDFAALGRVMDAVVDRLAAGPPRGGPPHRRLSRRVAGLPLDRTMDTSRLVLEPSVSGSALAARGLRCDGACSGGHGMHTDAVPLTPDARRAANVSTRGPAARAEGAAVTNSVHGSRTADATKALIEQAKRRVDAALRDRLPPGLRVLVDGAGDARDRRTVPTRSSTAICEGNPRTEDGSGADSAATRRRPAPPYPTSTTDGRSVEYAPTRLVGDAGRQTTNAALRGHLVSRGAPVRLGGSCRVREVSRG